MTATNDRPIRVIQWTTEISGGARRMPSSAARIWNWWASYAHGSDKVGLDAADLAGWSEPTGIIATNDVDALLAAQPDACCYNPLWPSVDELERLLEAGVNVCTSAAWITGGKQSRADLDRSDGPVHGAIPASSAAGHIRE